MRRISSLPTSEFCGMVDKIGVNVESVNALRSTCFHSFCETGKWPEQVKNLPQADFEEVQKWKNPTPLNLERFYGNGNPFIPLFYKDALKEKRVSLDFDFNFVETEHGLSPGEIDKKYPGIMVSGTLDIGWHLPNIGLVVISDIKSSIFAVKQRCKSLQLHAYGIGLAKALGANQYITTIWDACDGKYYVDDQVISLDSWEAEEYKSRIATAAKNEGNFVKGTHCGGCWKRDSCSAHLVEVPDNDQFKSVFDGTATEHDIRNALVAIKQLKSRAEKLDEACKSWAERRGPVRSEDGLKEWTCALRSGRNSLDQKAVEKEFGSLERFMKKGNDYPVWDWRNVKE
jgi:hypothetical protein